MSETQTESDRMHALALSTVERIEAQAAAIRWLEQHEDDCFEHYHEDGEGTTAEAEVERIEAVVNGHREVLDMEPISDPDELFGEGLEEAKDSIRFEGPLAISRHGVNHGDGWSTDRVQIVLGTGGPHVEVNYRGEAAHVTAYGWFREGETTLPVDPDAVALLYAVDDLYHDHE